MTTLRAHFDGRVLIPEEKVDLPIGPTLEIDVRETSELRRGSPALILKMLSEAPRLTAEDAEALKRAIAEGRQPLRDEGIFDDIAKEDGTLQL